MAKFETEYKVNTIRNEAREFYESLIPHKGDTNPIKRKHLSCTMKLQTEPQPIETIKLYHKEPDKHRA